MEKHPWLSYKNWAVVGASQDPARYGHTIVTRLHDNGFNVLPVSPKYEDIDGIKAYPTLSDIPTTVDVVNFVVNPGIGIQILDEVIKLGIKRIWIQPGAESDALIEKAKMNGIEVIEACILVVLAW